MERKSRAAKVRDTKLKGKGLTQAGAGQKGKNDPTAFADVRQR